MSTDHSHLEKWAVTLSVAGALAPFSYADDLVIAAKVALGSSFVDRCTASTMPAMNIVRQTNLFEIRWKEKGR